MHIAPEFLAVVRDALLGAGIDDEARVLRVAQKLAAERWSWVADPAGSTGFITSEAAAIKKDALASVVTKPNTKPTPPTPASPMIFGHTADEWRQLSALAKSRFMEAGIALASRRGEDATLIEARRALAENRADAEQLAAVAAADSEIRAAASTESPRANIRRTRRLADADLAAEIHEAGGDAIKAASSDAQIQKLAAGAGVFAVRNARRDLETAKRTLADPKATPNMKAYVLQLKQRAEKTLAKYGVA